MRLYNILNRHAGDPKGVFVLELCCFDVISAGSLAAGRHDVASAEHLFRYNSFIQG